jgi:hypothetical protein
MFQREKKALFPFILFGLFDPEGLGAEAGLGIFQYLKCPFFIKKPIKKLSARRQRVFAKYIRIP